MTKNVPRGPVPTDEQLAYAIKDALTSDLEPASRVWLLKMAGTWLPNLWAETKAQKPPTLVELFEEVSALARDETLGDADRGRRLADLLGDTDTLRVRLTHQYGPQLADDIVATGAELGPWKLHWPPKN